MAISARAEIAYNFAITQHGFIVIEHRTRILQLKLQQAGVQPRLFLAQHRIAADKFGFIGFNSKPQAGF